MLDVSTRESEDGDWVCRLEYPELTGCVAESRNALDAYEQVEALREQWLRSRLATGQAIPQPRPFLRC
ncbi:type II toxin-antitoxin system HicB family antitoxin [Streptomyces sp. NPDC001537]